MDDGRQPERDLATLTVALIGELVQTNDPWLRFDLVDAAGRPVAAAAEYFRDLQAAGRTDATIRSYGMDLLRWVRFVWAIRIPGNQGTTVEAPGLFPGVLVAGQPARPPLRHPGRV